MLLLFDVVVKGDELVAGSGGEGRRFLPTELDRFLLDDNVLDKKDCGLLFDVTSLVDLWLLLVVLDVVNLRPMVYNIIFG